MGVLLVNIEREYMSVQNKNQRTLKSPQGGWPDSFRELWDDLLYYKSFTSLDEAIVLERHADTVAASVTAEALEVRIVSTE